MKPKAPGEDALVEDSEDEDEGFLDSTFDRDCYFVITLVYWIYSGYRNGNHRDFS